MSSETSAIVTCLSAKNALISPASSSPDGPAPTIRPCAPAPPASASSPAQSTGSPTRSCQTGSLTSPRAGLITRTVDEGPPLAISYALTERGKALLPALEQITLWAQEHLVEDPT